ncbi:class I SAM-dependent methyltransferase, partial [Fangia hongkongensis]
SLYMDFSKTAFSDSYYFQAYIAAYLSGIVKSSGNVLEVGCGPGYLTSILSKLSSQSKFTLLDHSEPMLYLAEKNIQQLTGTSAICTIGDAVDLPFEDNTYDLVVSQFMLRNVPNPKKALLEAFRVLRSGGYVYFTDVISVDEPDRSFLIRTAPGKNGEHFIKAALDSALSAKKLEAIVSECFFEQSQILFGGFGGFTSSSRKLLDLVKDGLPLRNLVSRESSEWSKNIAKYWAHIYIKKP